MKVLILNCADMWGGGEVLTLGLARGLLDMGVDAHLGCNPDTIILKKAQEKKIPVITIPMRTSKDLAAIFNLRKIIKEEKFTIVHAQTMRDHILGAAAARLLKGVMAIRTQHIHFPEVHQFFLRIVYNKWTNMTICPSHYIRKNLENHSVNPAKVTVRNYGIDLRKYEYDRNLPSFREEMGFSDSNILIGCIGRLIKDKGQDFVIKAMPEVFEKFPSAKLVLVGSGEERECFENIAKNLEISDKVIFTGIRHDIPRILDSLDVALVPSVWNDPCPISVLEAMYAEVPLIATRVGGIPEEIDDGVTGVIVPPGDAEAIEKSILKLLDSPDKAKEMAKSARQKVIENFTLEGMCKSALDVYGMGRMEVG
ncbi:MAG: glycosyltransferase [Candidatus Eremiobacteraeota bacterium]|nr:glycosyltransferase [Candidatus Eremiobacteraeota bacterium]